MIYNMEIFRNKLVKEINMKKRIEELVKILNEASKAYYQQDTETMELTT